MKIFKGFILSLLAVLLLSLEVFSQSVNLEDLLNNENAIPFSKNVESNILQMLQSNEFDKLNKSNEEQSIFVKELIATDLNGSTYTHTYSYSSEGVQTSRTLEWVALDGASSITIYKSIFDDDGNVIGFISEMSTFFPSGNQYKSRYTYYFEGEGVSTFSEFWDGEQWVPNSRSLRTIEDTGGIVIEVSTTETWNGTEWEDDYLYSRRETRTYDSEGNLLQRLIEKHTGTNWMNDRRYNSSYNSNNNRTEYYTEKWEGGRWEINSGRTTRVYDANDVNISKITETWDGTNWNNYIKESYTRSAENKILLNLQERWENSNWVSQIKKTYSYNNDGYQLTYLKEFWKEDIWENVDRETHNYNYGALEVSYLSEKWIENNWENVNRSFSTFNNAENKTLGNYENWSAGEWTEYFGGIDYFELSGQLRTYGASTLEVTYTTITDIRKTGNIIAKYSLEQNYPNPFNPTTQITYQIPENGIVSLKIYNMLGQEVAELVNGIKTAGVYDVTFNAANLASGTYFYRLQSGNFIQTKKLMLIK